MALAPLLGIWRAQNLAAGVHGYWRDNPATRQLLQGLPRVTWRFTLPASAPRSWGSLHPEQSNPSLPVVQKFLLDATPVWHVALEWNHCALPTKLTCLNDWLQLFLISKLLDVLRHSDDLLNSRLPTTDHLTPPWVLVTWSSRYDPNKVWGSCPLCRTYVARRGPQRFIQRILSLHCSNFDILVSRASRGRACDTQIANQWQL